MSVLAADSDKIRRQGRFVLKAHEFVHRSAFQPGTAADGPIGPHAMLWSGIVPPPMRGAVEDRIHRLENYREHCTLISGRFRQGVREVTKLLGRAEPGLSR